MGIIKNKLVSKVGNIKGKENEQAALAFEMYDIIKEYISDIVSTNFGSSKSKLAILGGIMINCDGDGTDMFLPMKFELKTKT